MASSGPSSGGSSCQVNRSPGRRRVPNTFGSIERQVELEKAIAKRMARRLWRRFDSPDSFVSDFTVPKASSSVSNEAKGVAVGDCRRALCSQVRSNQNRLRNCWFITIRGPGESVSHRIDPPDSGGSCLACRTILLLQMLMEPDRLWGVFVDSGRIANEAIGTGSSSAKKASPRCTSGHQARQIETKPTRPSDRCWADNMGLPVAAEFRPQIVYSDRSEYWGDRTLRRELAENEEKAKYPICEDEIHSD